MQNLTPLIVLRVVATSPFHLNPPRGELERKGLFSTVKKGNIIPCDTSRMKEQDQAAVCREHGREFVPCPPDSKLGVATQTLGQTPIHGLRHPPVGETNGWYI